jgi:CheY-like chemotaxis protein
VREGIDLSQEEITAASLGVSTDLAASDHHVHGDGARLLQVMRNLLSNAIRNTPRGGRIVIGSSNPRSGHVEVKVTDSGAGMASDVLQRLFRPFEQGVERSGRGGGLGLGLAISRGIVEAHRGSIVAHSDGPGCGATFVATFPAVAGDGLDEPHDDGGRGRQATRPSAQAKVLLVEDNRDNAAAIAALLHLEGYEVEVADSVADALQKAERGFDILVSDIGLPDGSGRDLMRRLCAGRAVHGIALTGYGTDEDVRLDTEAGFAAHLTKPVDPDKLMELLADFGRSAPLRDESGATASEATRAKRRRSV